MFFFRIQPLYLSINEISDVKYIELKIKICLPVSTCLYVYLTIPIWHGIATSLLSATACGWPQPLPPVLSPSVWHLQPNAIRRTITSLFQPHCFIFTHVSVSKVRVRNFNFYPFIFHTICNHVTSFHFSDSLWLHLLSQLYLYILPLHY